MLDSDFTVRVFKDDLLLENIQQDSTIKTNIDNELEINEFSNYCCCFNKADSLNTKLDSINSNNNADYNGGNGTTKN